MKKPLLLLILFFLGMIIYFYISTALLSKSGLGSGVIEIIIITPLAVTGLAVLSLLYDIFKTLLSKSLLLLSGRKDLSNTEIIGFLIAKYWYVFVLIIIIALFSFFL